MLFLVTKRATRCLTALIPILLLSACASAPRRESSYGSYTQTRPTKATQRPYTVNGKRYEPLATHEGFAQEGIASSYGRKFHGRKTSSGETFNMHAMTAAHKTLPMGVYVKVQHKRTNREVIVRINDRGPFVRNRIVDLSTAAAEKLGILQEGLAPVRLTALGYKSESGSSTSAYRQPASYDTGNFTLQVGAFTIRENAYRYAAELKLKYGSGDVQDAYVGGKKFYRVRSGRYGSLKEAQAAQDRYEQGQFPNCFVVAVE